MTHAPTPTSSPLDALRDALDRVRLPLELPGANEARDIRQQSLRQIDDYIGPRLANLDAPLLAVVGGSTGAGKSTIVNGLVGNPVTRTGAIRPTTRQPILLHHPADRDAFASARILPDMSRITGTRVAEGTPSNKAGDDPDAALISSVVLVSDDRIPRELAVLDAPDVDSIADENRALANQLLAAADLWLFVTTANRYADAVPWRLLDDAAGRDITVGVVLNRVPEGAEGVEEDLRLMLAERGLGRAPVFVIPEAPLSDLGMLPDEMVRPIRDWLHGIAADRAQRQEVARRTVAGAAARVGEHTRTVANAREEQIASAKALLDAFDARYSEACARVIDSTRDGTLLRTEVLARWQDYVGTSDVLRSLETWFARARDRAAAWVQGRPAPVREVEVEIEHGLLAVILDEAGRAAGESWQRLRESPAGRRIAAGDGLGRESSDLHDRATALIRDWQGMLMQIIQDRAGSKRVEARIMSLGLNAVTVTLMVVIFASTGGLTGGEIAVAGGSAVVGQKLLETLFGDEAVRELADEARRDLDWRLNELFSQERARYDALVEPVLQGPSPAELVEAARALEVSVSRTGDTRSPASDSSTASVHDHAVASGGEPAPRPVSGSARDDAMREHPASAGRAPDTLENPIVAAEKQPHTEPLTAAGTSLPIREPILVDENDETERPHAEAPTEEDHAPVRHEPADRGQWEYVDPKTLKPLDSARGERNDATGSGEPTQNGGGAR